MEIKLVMVVVIFITEIEERDDYDADVAQQMLI
jgi:hypothetical protein